MADDEQKIDIVTVRLPKPIVEWLDSLVKKGIYNSRSEIIRDFSREFVERHQGGKNE
ncbi:ribbon-helix-helix protein, CopG family [Candidatus Woesearchaeota archaeon]|nr:ribbon-helix-helix protein, CopG family [Candidatus Woesearchaeota archaeon]